MRRNWLAVLRPGVVVGVAVSCLTGVSAQTSDLDHPVVTAISPASGKSDEAKLREADVPTDGPGLLDYFRKRTQESANRSRLQALIAQLGDDDFQIREQASNQLVQLGVRAKPVLLDATKDADLEVAIRARDCLRRIESGTTAMMLGAAIRTLVERKPDGAAEALLSYLPFAEDETLSDEALAGLAAIAIRDGRSDPALVAALTDKQAIKRGAAAEALCRAGAKEQLAEIRKLLKDSDARVRLRVGLALCSLGEREALPVLIELLTELPSPETAALENMLYKLAGQKAPPGDDATDNVARRRYRDAWKKWWETEGTKLDAAKLEETSKTLGYTLVLMLDSGKAVELDSTNKPRWTVEGLAFPLDVEALPGDRLLSAEHRANRVTERDVKTGKVVWEHKIAYPLSAQRLPNGNTFIGSQNNLVEVDKTGKVVWEYYPPGGENIMKASKLRNGDIALVTQLGATRFILLDRDGKTEKRSFAINLYTTGGRIDVLPNGNVIVPENANNRVVELEPVGQVAKVVWEAIIESPVAATRLANGHMLITSMSSSKGAVEIDRTGREIWSYKTDTRVTRAMRR
jgi:hypothetical protein